MEDHFHPASPIHVRGYELVYEFLELIRSKLESGGFEEEDNIHLKFDCGR
jgi:hypothetical protein